MYPGFCDDRTLFSPNVYASSSLTMEEIQFLPFLEGVIVWEGVCKVVLVRHLVQFKPINNHVCKGF